jgi:uncharacterized membrane protein YeaQ/YmgE (transglycosylase-associated protein family)
MLKMLGIAIFGLVVGMIAKLLVPGRDPGGVFVTVLIGMAGALIGLRLGRLFPDLISNEWVLSIGGAVLILLLYRLLSRLTRQGSKSSD